jgi:hypothetical protein
LLLCRPGLRFSCVGLELWLLLILNQQHHRELLQRELLLLWQLPDSHLCSRVVCMVWL